VSIFHIDQAIALIRFLQGDEVADAMQREFIRGPAKVFARPLDPRDGNEWVHIGDAKGIQVSDAVQKHLSDVAASDSALLVTEEAAVMNAVTDICGEMEQDKGFREDADNANYLRELPRRLNLGIEDKAMLEGIADRIDVLNNVCKLMLMVSELAEAMTALRKSEDGYGEELADVVIRVMANAHQNKIPLGDEIVRKIDKNSGRPHKHGRNF
jgi:NTP pyrophosphatase (non-canonical NTP hydrolase)